MTNSDLHQHRLNLGLNVAQFARYLGVSGPTVSQWEHGKHPIPLPIQKLIVALQKLEVLERPVLPTFLPEPAKRYEPGLCACGCGGRTVKNWRSDKSKGWVKGEYRQYISGHNIKVFKRAS